MTGSTPLVSVYIPCHNYASYVATAIQSVIAQTFTDWDLLVVDDGSTDESWSIINGFASDARITVERNESPLGLRQVANRCIRQRGSEFVLRLDADDILHPLCLELLVREARRSPAPDFVFSDFYYMDEVGEVVGVELLPSESGTYEAHTFPPHGAASLVRRELLLSLGGYSEDIRRQDGHEVWLKILGVNAHVRHVALPLFFYRKHGSSLSDNIDALLGDRATIKREIARSRDSEERVLAIVPVKNTYPDMPDLPFRRYKGQRLIDLALAAAIGVVPIDDVVITTDSGRVADYVRRVHDRLTVLKRSEDLLRPSVTMRDVLIDTVQRCDVSSETILMVLNANTPRRTQSHVRTALDTYLIHRPDSVATVYEEQNLIYQMGSRGLRPLNASYQYKLRREREVVYVDTGAVRVFKAQSLSSRRYLGDRIAHAVMKREDAVQIRSPADLSLLDPYETAEALLSET